MKTHDLVELIENPSVDLDLDTDEIRILALSSDYHLSEAYPVTDRILPENSEIQKVMDFAELLFEKICMKLQIESEELKIEP